MYSRGDGRAYSSFIPEVGLDDETRELKPFVYLEVKDGSGAVINRIKATNKEGFNRVSWDLTVGGSNALSINADGNNIGGFLCAPGKYTATLNSFTSGKVNQLAGPVEVEVTPLRSGTLEGSSMEDVVSFWRAYEELSRDVSAMSIQLSNSKKRVELVFKAAMKANVSGTTMQDIAELRSSIGRLDTQVNGNPAKNQIGEKNRPTIGERLFSLNRGISNSTYGPTDTHRRTMEIVKKELGSVSNQLAGYRNSLSELANQVKAAGGSWVE